MFEAVEGILNIQAYIHLVRPWDYMGVTMGRVAHQVRWFSGVTRSATEQGKLLERWVNEILVKNTQRARQSKPPPVYEEMLAIAKSVCNMAGLADTGLTTGDPYCRVRVEDSRIKDLENTVKQLRGQLDRERGKRDRSDRGNYEGNRSGPSGNRGGKQLRRSWPSFASLGILRPGV